MDGRCNDNVPKEESRCFVCDDEVRSRYYTLATCKTKNSQTSVIQKLGELVGERYMFVISEDDVICRSCAILINTFDRLEIEMRNIRDIVLQFIKRKYALTDGDLQGSSDKPKPCQRPQITKSSTKEITSHCTEQEEIDLETYAKNKKKKLHSWLQCDKCKYTTQLNSFMMYHLRDHMKQKIYCDKCGMCVSENQDDTNHNCIGADKLENKENEKDNSSTIVKTDSMDTSPLETTLMIQPILLPTQASPPLSLSNCDHLYMTNVPITTPNTPTSSKPMIYVLQQDANMVNIDDLGKIITLESNPI